MKTLIAALIISNIAQAEILYTCTSSEGYQFEVERTERNSIHVSVEAPAELPELGYFCYGNEKDNSRVLSVLSRAEVIGEEPSRCSFKLNKKTLVAEYAYKKWDGYFRGPFTRPVKNVKLTAKCVAAE